MSARKREQRCLDYASPWVDAVIPTDGVQSLIASIKRMLSRIIHDQAKGGI